MEGLAHVAMTPLERNIVEVLAATFPAGMSEKEIAQKVYGKRPSGGPEYAVSVVSVLLHRLRRRVKPYGWGVGAFGQYGNIRLKRLDA